MGKTCHMIGEKHGQNMLHGIESEMMGKICNLLWENMSHEMGNIWNMPM